jgi:uncharacterized damage-inducible protein DinB
VNARVKPLFDRLEVQRVQLQHLIKDLSDVELNKHPAEKWSIAQVISHLIASEQLSVGYLNKKMLGIQTAEKSGLKEDLKMLLLIVSQRLPFKFKAPRTIVENTPVYGNVDQLISAWDKTRVDLKEVLQKFEDDQINLKIFKHPRAGMLNIQQAIRFFREHIIHHTPQVKNLLKQN